MFSAMPEPTDAGPKERYGATKRRSRWLAAARVAGFVSGDAGGSGVRAVIHLGAQRGFSLPGSK